MAIHPHGTLLAVLVLMFLFSGSESAACPTGVVRMNVSTPDEAQQLVDALDCTGGGIFDVSWSGRVVISEPFAFPTATALTLASLVLTGGLHVPSGDELGQDWGGGAIAVVGAGVSISNCTFRNNSSSGMGPEAIPGGGEKGYILLFAFLGFAVVEVLIFG